jgi:diguanylate cyclase (GGDEF)-like protein
MEPRPWRKRRPAGPVPPPGIRGPDAAVPGTEGDSLLSGLLDTALGIVASRRGSLMLLGETGELQLLQSRGLPAPPDDAQAAPRDGPARRALVEDRPLHLEGPVEGRAIDEALVLPLRTARGPLGALNLSRVGGRPWSLQRRERAIRFSDSVAEVLDVVRAGRDRDRRMAELDRVLAFSRIFGSTRELSKIFELLLSCARELTGCRAAFVTLYTLAGERHEAWAGHRLAEDVLERLIEGLRLSFGHEFFSQARPHFHSRLAGLEEGHPLRLLAREGLAERAVVVPLVFGYRILGRLYLLDTDGLRLHRDTLRLLMLLAHEASIAVEQARSIRELQEMAFVDPLTRAWNRNYWIQRFEEELIRGERLGQPLSLLMVDIDHFKAYNDTYGHLVGDEVLRMVAQVIKSCLREVDVVGRFGGEEFGVLLPDTDEAGANFVAERIRLMVERLDLGTPVRGGKLTISLGIASAGGRRLTVEELIRRADTALFVSKEHGRNRVSVYSPEGVLPVQGLVPPPAEDPPDRGRLDGSSDFLFRMSDSLGGAREHRPLNRQLGFRIVVGGGREGEHRPLAQLFDSLGYLARIVESTRREPEIFGDETLPDLAIIDLDHPPEGVEGLALLAELKSRDPLLPVVVLTASEDLQQAIEAVRLGADDYLLKPFGAREIRQCVEKAFSKRLRLLRSGSQGSVRESRLNQELDQVSTEVRREFVRSARELRIMQEFNRRSLEHPTKGALMLDRELKIVQLNRLAAETLGLNEDEALNDSLFGAAPVLDNPRIANALTHVEQTGEPMVINDFWLKSAGAEASALHKLSFAPVLLDSGESYLLVLLENMLDQRLLEEESRRMRIRVAQEISGRIAQQLQVISGRAELLQAEGGSVERSSLQMLAAVRAIGHILGELGSDLPAALSPRDGS